MSSCHQEEHPNPNIPHGDDGAAVATETNRTTAVVGGGGGRKCVVCGGSSFFNYYGVQSCEGCKQFFRRVILKKMEFFCLENNRCSVKKARDQCKGCRLDRCLLAGMDATLTLLPNSPDTAKYLAKLEQRAGTARQRLLADDRTPPAAIAGFFPSPSRGFPMLGPDESILLEAIQTLRALNSIEESIKRFLQAMEFRIFKIDLLDAMFPTLREMLSAGTNLVQNFTIYTKPTQHKYDLYKTLNLIATMEFVRMMPVFNQLQIEDQVCLLGYVGLPLMGLSVRFYSASMHRSQLVVTPDGNSSILHYFHDRSKFAEDKTVLKLADLLLHQSMEPLNRLRLRTEEFLMLKAIILTHAATSGLSEPGKLLLQRESERYARLLMHSLRVQHGELLGARRYADILQLAENTFHVARRTRDFFAYLAMVADQGDFHANLPRAFVPLCLHGIQQKEDSA